MPKVTLQDKVAIVTGASSGIGRATALALAREGADVVLASRNLSALKEVAREVKALGRQALPIPCDVPQAEQVKSMVAETIERFGRVDILIANAGQYIRAPIIDMPISLLEQSMAVNFYGHVNAVQAVLPHMIAQGSGHIVFVNTMDALTPLTPDTPYVAAKSALHGFAEVLRQELLGSGVYATTVYPGRVDTPMIEQLKVPWVSAKVSAESVARAILKAIRRRQARVIVLPFQARLLYYSSYFIPPSVSDRTVLLLNLKGREEA